MTFIKTAGGGFVYLGLNRSSLLKSIKKGSRNAPLSTIDKWDLVCQPHAAGGFRAEVNTHTEKVGGASRFATFATNTIFSTRRRCDLTGLAAVPRHHL